MTTTATTPTRLSVTVDRFLDAIAGGAGVPAKSPASTECGSPVRRRSRNWSGCRLPVASGEVVTYLLTWEENGVPQAAHHCHVPRFGGAGCIAQDRFFCGGRWDAALLAEMAAAEHAG